MNHLPPNEEHERAERYLRGEMTAEEVTTYESFLCENSDARARFRRLVRLDANLRALAAAHSAEAGAWASEISPTHEASEVSHRDSSRDWPSWRSIVTVAGLAAALAVMGFLWVYHRPSAPIPTPSQYVATLSSTRDCEWADGQTLLPGSRLGTGDYSLRKGAAEMQFDGGARLLVEGPANFKVEGRGSMLLGKGNVFFHSDASAEPFSLRTPRSVFLDLGTEYAAVVRPDDEELHVMNGEVRRSPSRESSARPEVTTAGTARRYVSARESGFSIPLNPALADAGRQMAAPAAPSADSLLAFDRFEYQAPPAEGRDWNSGAGWRSRWVPHPGLAPISFDPQHCLQWPGVADVGGAVKVSGRAAMHRYLKRPVALGRDGVYYFSFLFRRAPALPHDLNMIMLVLRKSGLTAEQEIEQHSVVKVSITQANAVASVQFCGSTTRASLPLDSDTTYFLAAKIVSGRSLPGQVFVRVYRPGDVVPESEPAVWSVASEPLRANMDLDQVSLEVDSKAEVSFDKFKLGESWAAIVP